MSPEGRIDVERETSMSTHVIIYTLKITITSILLLGGGYLLRERNIMTKLLLINNICMNYCFIINKNVTNK